MLRRLRYRPLSWPSLGRQPRIMASKLSICTTMGVWNSAHAGPQEMRERLRYSHLGNINAKLFRPAKYPNQDRYSYKKVSFDQMFPHSPFAIHPSPMTSAHLFRPFSTSQGSGP